MKSFKILFLILALVLVSGLAQAQGKADVILKQSQEKFNSLTDITSSLSYTFSNPNLDATVIKKGSITQKKNKYKTVFEEEEFYCNGKIVWVLLKEEEEITKTHFDPSDNTTLNDIYILPSIAGKTRYDRDYGDSHKISFFPNDKEAEIWKTELWINKSTKLVEQAILHSTNGSFHLYTMQNIQTNTGVDDAAFIINEAEYGAKLWYINDMTE